MDIFKKGSTKHLSDEELLDLIKTCGGLRATARFLSVDHSAIQGRLNRMGVSFDDVMSQYQDEIAPKQENAGISGDCIITADYHNPFCSLRWVERAIGMGKREKINQLVCAGDFFDMDRLSWWLRQSRAEEIAVPLGKELSFAEMVLERFETQFDRIIMIGGNHWKRLLKQITYSVPTNRLMGLVGRKDDSRYVYTGLFEWTLLDEKIRITHPGKARKLDYTLARDLSILYPNQWLVVAHRHRTNEGFTPDGRPMWEIGWMGDTERMRYIQHVDSTYYNWVNGFMVYKDGAIRNLTEFNYDWSKIDK